MQARTELAPIRRSPLSAMMAAMQSAVVGPTGTALITGASHRVGRAVALELARAGFGLWLTFRTRASECEETARLAKDAALGAGHAMTTRIDKLDLNDTAAVEAYAQLVRGSGALDCIVHNASSFAPTVLEAIDAASVESMYRSEVVSPLLLTTRVRTPLASSRLSGGAAVVFFSDIHAIDRARAGFTPYLLAKSAVQTLARQLAVELAPRVRVHCVAPGVIAWPEGVPTETKDAILARTPLARAGTAEEAARLVRFLVLEASYLTGETIAIDGGRGLR